ncbi:MAG: hypothetical protein JEZ02_20440 [Desulfatibacillum sp.]|nr:hypothetical protein [Desulfatibacillum sp.]
MDVAKAMKKPEGLKEQRDKGIKNQKKRRAKEQRDKRDKRSKGRKDKAEGTKNFSWGKLLKKFPPNPLQNFFKWGGQTHKMRDSKINCVTAHP